jgi:predicted outer membrane repeat protein
MSQRSLRRAAARRAAAGSRRQARLSRRTGQLAAVAIGTGAMFAPGASAATFEVTTTADAGAGSLRQALADANLSPDADTVVFAAGVRGEIALASTLEISGPTTIQGPGADALTLSGGGTTRILQINAVEAEVTIAGLTFADGLANDNGGAVQSNSTGLTITDSVFTGNTATFHGGAISVNSGSLTLSGSRLTGNTSGDYGGGLHVTYLGGALTVSDSLVTGNTAGRYGGGLAVYDQSGPVVIDRSTFSGNAATAYGGGGVWLEDVYNGQPVTVSNSTLSGNTAGTAGGGISFGENFSGDNVVVNTTVVGNTARDGGGIQFGDQESEGEVLGTFALRSSTVTGNTATGTGGGVFRGFGYYGGGDSALTVTSSVVAENTAVSGGPDFARGEVVGDLTIGNSLVGELEEGSFVADPDGTVLIGVDPKLGALSDNGGPTQTRLPAPDSPLVDAGLAGGRATDQRGLARTYDVATVAQTLASDGTDIGAAELVQNAPPTLALPGAQAVDEGGTLVFGTGAGNAIGVGDPEGQPVEVTLGTDRGTLSVPQKAGLTFTQGDGSADATLQFSGALGDVRAALDGLSLAAPADAGGSSATLSVSVQDRPAAGAGTPGSASGSVAVTIRDATAAAPPAPPLCNGVAVALSPVLSGGRVRITGVTLPRYAGERVRIVSSGRTVATVRPNADGTFRTTLRAPRKGRSTLAYRAVVDGIRSPAYRLDRETLVLSQSGRTISGRVILTGKRRATRGTLYRDASCTQRARVATVKISKSGAFRAQLSGATGDFSVYRLRVRLSPNTVSWSAPVFVLPR